MWGGAIVESVLAVTTIGGGISRLGHTDLSGYAC